jgi:DNA repair protein RadC
VQAVAELARRHQPRPRLQPPVHEPRQALAYFHELRTAGSEVMAALLLDGRLAAIGDRAVPVSRGGVAHVATLPREVFGPALARGASALVLAHNHPSGNLAPSPEDVEFTEEIVRLGHSLDVAVLDHLIVTRRGYLSLAAAGLLPRPRGAVPVGKSVLARTFL